MHKKIVLFLSMFFLSFSLLSCKNKQKEKKVYEEGDQIIQNGIVYTYYTQETLYMEPIPFVEEENYKPYYNYYYYDMSDVKNQNAIDIRFRGRLKGMYGQGYLNFYPETFYDYLRYTDPIHSPTDAYFFRLGDFLSSIDTYKFEVDDSDNTLEGGFVVTSYTEKLQENVVVDMVIDDIPVLHIGYKAFENAPMKTFEFTSSLVQDVVFIHPYAFSSCQNLEKVTTNACVLSMGICNCPKLKIIEKIRLSSDCSLYNLQNLRYLYDLDARPLRPLNSSGYSDHGFYQSIGIRKSSIYLCPKVNLMGRELKEKDHVYYYKDFPYYCRYDRFKITLKDEYFTNLRYDNYACITYNPETMQMYLPFLNSGIKEFKCEIEIDPNSKHIEQREDGYYVQVRFPKIERGLKFYSEEYLDSIELKIIPKL